MNNPQQPGKYDAVLGGNHPYLESAAVLGGIEGVKLRLQNPNPQVRIVALQQALNYGQAGLDVVIAALNDQSWDVQDAAYLILSDRTEAKVKQALISNLQGLKLENIELVTTNKSGQIIQRRQGIVKYFTEDLGNGVSLEMAQIPGGTFMMGSPEDEEGRWSDESPQHQVTVPGFFMGKYPVTQAQYQAIMGDNPSRFKGGGWTSLTNRTSLTNQRPVENVTWSNAVTFCQRLSERTGRNYTLPSEAQWEYACRAGTTTPFYFGESITPDLVNYDGNYTYASAPKGKYREQTTDVGSFPPNAFGLYDMHGNVWEWCQDTWHDNYINAPTDGSAWIEQSTRHISRGGSWVNFTWVCRCATRFIFDDFDINYTGFRVVRVPPRT